MKKQIKFLLNIIICLSLLLPVGVFAASSINLNSKSYIKTGSGSDTISKFKTNKGFAYCITPGKSGPGAGTTLYLKNTIKSGGLVYLLDNANTSDSSFLITQLAVWKYSNNYSRAASSSNWSKANKLVSDAKKNSTYTTTPSVLVKASSSSLSESGNYYKSSKITLTIKNIKKDLKVQLVNAPKGAIIVNSDGTKKTSFKNGDVIYVWVPEANVTTKTSFTIQISGTGYNSYVERYKSNNSNHQELIILVKETKKVTSSTKLSITPVVRICKTHNGKYYGKNGKIVDKKTYELECGTHSCKEVYGHYFNKNGKEVDKKTFELECGTYSCKEVYGHYFDKNGNEVDKKTFELECGTHICKEVYGHYFDKAGNEVDKKDFELECGTHICKEVYGHYFDKNGIEVDYHTFDRECNVHKCDVIDGIYFGINGDRVNLETYKNQCESKPVPPTPPTPVNVPDTADYSGLLYILIGAVLLGTTMGVLETFSKSRN